MYYIKVITNISTYYWNDTAQTFVVYQENATNYSSWIECDKRCAQLNDKYNGKAFFQRKTIL